MSGGAFEADLATTDPLHGIHVRIEPGPEGVIALHASVTGPSLGVTAVGMGFAARAGERYLGFGERSNAVDQRGNAVENYVADGPYRAQDRFLAAPLVPSVGFRFRDDATYFPMPWLLSTAGYGVLLDNTELSNFRLGTENSAAWSLEAESTSLHLRFVAGPTPADVLRRLTGLTGRQPPPASPWVFGPWYQGTGADRVRQARQLREADVPVSALQTYLHYLPCGDQQGVEANQPRNNATYHGLGLAVTTYFNPMICTDYQPAYGQASAAGVLTENALGGPYVYPYTGSTIFTVSQFDFSSQAGRSFYAGLLNEAVGHGYDGWMEDFGEYTPLDSQSANGMSGTEMHNLYPRQYHCASWDYAKTRTTPPVAFIRSGWTGVHPCAQVVWGGDPSTTWDFDGLESSVKQALSLGTSGISRWGSDIGGFFQILGPQLSPELLVRWIEFGAVSGVMRTQANGFSTNGQRRPQIFDAGIAEVWRRYSKLRTQLYPYILAADAEYRRTGLPVMRHHALTHPGDATAAAKEDQFMFGPDLLAAPVLRPGVTSRTIHAPAGRWVDFWRAVAYSPGPGSFSLRRSPLLKGGGSLTVPAPSGELPMLVRAGAVLAMLPSSVDTLAPYGSDDTVRLEEVGKRLHLLAFPRGRSVSRFGESGVLVSRARKRVWKLTLKGAAKHRVRLEASLTTPKRKLRPCAVKVNGKKLKRKRWKVKGRVLRVSFRAPRAKTRVAVLDRKRCGSRRRARN